MQKFANQREPWKIIAISYSNTYKYIKRLLTMLLNVYITVDKQRWSLHVLQCSNIITILQVFLRLCTISSLLQGFRAPALEQTHSVLCDLLSLGTDINSRPQPSEATPCVLCRNIGMQARSKGRLQRSDVCIWFCIGFTFSHLSPNY